MKGRKHLGGTDRVVDTRGTLPVWIAVVCSLTCAAHAYDPLNGDYTRADPLDVRILSYNHHGDFISDPSRDAAFDRILTAIDPDIICFQEFPSSISQNDVISRLDTVLPSPPDGWRVHFGLLGGIRTVIASRFPLSMTRTDTVPGSATRGVTIALADLPDADYPVDVYLLGVHLKCCGDPGGSEDASRQDSADAIANWLGDARGISRPSGDNVSLPTDTPMINLGDFNLVGGPQPETTLITGDIQDQGTYGPDVKGDWDNSDMTDLGPTDPFTGDDFTWQGNQSYPPGRLDRFFFTDSVVTVANSFILNSDTMTPAALAVAGLQAGDTLPANSSDHLPMAMDLRLAGAGCSTNGDCDDGLYCNGAETCVGGQCQAGTAPDCGDGVVCTDDSCNQGTDSCDNIPNHGSCDDTLYCNGTEACDAQLGCQSGTAIDCDDGVPCTVDSCNEGTDSCDNLPDDAACANGLFCDGTETCDTQLGCQAGSDPCPGQACDEGGDRCIACQNNADCDNGLYCDGAEFCDANNQCLPGADPCPGRLCRESDDTCVDCLSDGDCDDLVFCNGAESCDSGGLCQGGGDPCPGQICDESGDRCVDCDDDADCDDGNPCNGLETCDVPAGTCQPGSCDSVAILIDENFDADQGGFTYQDDTFGTSNPAFAAGTYEGSGGFNGGGLRVYLGPGDMVNPASGGWSEQFNLAEAGTVTVTLRYRMLMGEGYESNEYGETILDVDGTRYGNDTNDSLVHLAGNGNGGGTEDTGWLSDQFDISLWAGSHTITVGAYNNDATFSDEWVEVFIDDVNVSTTAGGPCECDDGLFCNGAEVCDGQQNCVSAGFPCTGGDWCDEGDDLCVAHGNGDFEPDGDVDLTDLAAFLRCFGTPTVSPCQPANMVGVDGTLDLQDFDAFSIAVTGP